MTSFTEGIIVITTMLDGVPVDWTEHDSVILPGEGSLPAAEFQRRTKEREDVLALYTPENMAARATHLRKMRLLGLMPPQDDSCPF